MRCCSRRWHRTRARVVPTVVARTNCRRRSLAAQSAGSVSQESPDVQSSRFDDRRRPISLDLQRPVPVAPTSALGARHLLHLFCSSAVVRRAGTRRGTPNGRRRRLLDLADSTRATGLSPPTPSGWLHAPVRVYHVCFPARDRRRGVNSPAGSQTRPTDVVPVHASRSTGAALRRSWYRIVRRRPPNGIRGLRTPHSAPSLRGSPTCRTRDRACGNILRPHGD